MIGEHARLFTSGGWGRLIPPAFAYDLTKGEMYKRARSSGLIRYGKAPGSNDEDDRPLGLAYTIEWATGIEGNEMSPDVDSSELTPLGNPFYGEEIKGLGQTDPAANQAVGYKGLDVKRNGAWSLWCYLHTPPKGQIIKLQQWFVGVPGAGYVFQIRAGTAEIAGLSKDWNAGEMQLLRELWGVKNPTQEETDEIDELKRKLFVDFESLSFENSTGKGDWYGNEFKVSFIPESRGVLHIVLEGLDATAHQFKDIIKTRQPGVINERSPITLYSAGGAFFFALGYLRFRAQAKMSFGPFKNGYFTEYLGDLSYNYNASIANGQTVTMTRNDIDEVHFGFDIDIVNPDPNSTPWIWAIAARIAPGERVPVEEENGFDSDVKYVPANPAAPKPPDHPILDIQPTWDGMFNRRCAKVSMINMLGTLQAGKNRLDNRVATVETATGRPFITDGLVVEVSAPDASSLKPDTQPLYIARAESELVATVADGWHRLYEMDCAPPPIGDNQRLGTHFRELLATGGVPESKMAGIPHEGRRLGRAALGEDWASRVDRETKIGDAIRSLFECYGLGWMPYVDNYDNWHMVHPSIVSGPEFSSSRSPNPFTESGRRSILTPIDITYDTSNFWNQIIIYGGENGDIVGEWTNWESVLQPLSPSFIGRLKTKCITNTGLRTRDDVNYALRSAKWFYGRVGRRAEFQTSFHTELWAGHQIPADGALWEVEGMSGGSWAKDNGRFSVFEVINQ